MKMEFLLTLCDYLYYSWMVTAEFDDDLVISPTLWIKKPNGNDSVKGDVLVACPLWIN